MPAGMPYSLLYPSCSSPKFLEWTSFVTLQPPTAEDVLQTNEGNTQEQAKCVTAILIQTKAPTIEQHTTKNRLRHVVGQTHLTIRSDNNQLLATLSAMIQPSDARYIEQHHAKVHPSLEHYTQRMRCTHIIYHARYVCI